MTIEEIEKLLEVGKVLDNVHTKMGGSPSQMLPAIEFLLSEVKRLRDKISQHKIETWKRGDHPIIDADLTLWKEGK